MTESEALLIRNVLNGVELAVAAAAAGMAVENAEAVFREAMLRVAEYQLVHCVPYFPVNNIAEARRSRLRVIEILDDIQDWDNGDRELALAVFAGQNVLREGIDREHAERVVNRVLEALPYYLEKGDLPLYLKDRKGFIRANRGKVRGLVERFVSFRTPLLHKRIIHQTVSSPEALLANLRNA